MALPALILFTMNLTVGLAQQQDPFVLDSLLQTNHIYKQSIRTVQLYKKGWELSYPVIKLDSEDQLALSFDELSNQVGDYYYTFVHCDATWNHSELMEAEYLDGFPENQINDYVHSFNTTVQYIHYNLSFPNEDIRFRISGNYILMVYEDYDKTRPILTRRFMVFENKVNVRALLKRSSLTKHRETGQEIQVLVNYPGYEIINPYQEVTVAISQNGRWDNAVLLEKPSFLRTHELVYDFDEKNIFQGGNEYRRFDIKSLRFQTEFVERIDFIRPYYHIGLFPSVEKPRKAYFYEQDINGRFYIKIDEGVQSSNESDYVKVYFTLKRNVPYILGDVYVFGALSDWSCTWTNHMIYNYDAKAYEVSMLLKQGYYNFEYAVKSPGSPLADNTVIEGSHYQTENDYLVFVYHYGSGSRYHRLVGFLAINSRANL